MDVQYLNQLITTAQRIEKLGGGTSGASDLQVQKFDLSQKKFQLDQKKFLFDQYKVEVDKAKSTIGRLTGLYDKTKSVGMKNHIRNTMSDFYETTDPVLRKALEPYIQHSPISSLEQKKLNYDQLYKRQPEPLFNSEAKNYQNYATRWFKWKDSEDFRTNFITGKKPEKELTLAMPEGFIAVRSSDNMVRTLSPEQQGLEKVSEDTGVSVRDIITGGGWIKQGEQYLVREGGVERMLQNETNILTRQQRSIVKSQKDLGVERKSKELPGDLKKLLSAVISETYDKTPMAKKLHELLIQDLMPKKDGVVQNLGFFNQAMQQLYPDYVFIAKTVDYPTAGTVDRMWSFEKNLEVLPLHAQQLVYKTKRGKILNFFRRWSDGVILNKDGEELMESQELLEDTLKAEGSL